MFEIKPIHKESIEKSLEKAHRYRLLNEPSHAESICLDVLIIEPENQQAINILLLALTDQFDRRLTARYKQARELLPRLEDSYRRVYYDGLICERRATALYRRGGPGSGSISGFRVMMREHVFQRRMASSLPSGLRASAFS